MTIQTLYSILKQIDQSKVKGGKHLKQRNAIFLQEANTHNIEKLLKLTQKDSK